MKKTISVTLAALLTVSAYAQNYYMAEQQARRVSQQNDAEQQRIANAAGNVGGAAAAPAPPGAPPADPMLQATLSNIANLQADLAGFAKSDQPDAAQKNSFLNNASQAAQSKKASPDSAKELANDLQKALAGKTNLTAVQQKQLAAFIHATFNGSHLTDAQSEKIFTTAQKVLTDVGVSTDDAVNVVTDLKKIAAETK
jgi:hypothetical protein